LLADWRGPTSITRIGDITDGSDVLIKGADGKTKTLQAKGYDHLG